MIGDYLSNGLTPRDQGALDAHRIGAGPTKEIERCLKQATWERRWGLGLIFPWRRRYLGGLIHGLEQELERRARDGR